MKRLERLKVATGLSSGSSGPRCTGSLALRAGVLVGCLVIAFAALSMFTPEVRAAEAPVRHVAETPDVASMASTIETKDVASATATVRLDRLIQGTSEDDDTLIQDVDMNAEENLARSPAVARHALADATFPRREFSTVSEVLSGTTVAIVGDRVLEISVEAAGAEVARQAARALAEAYLRERADQSLTTLRDVGEEVSWSYLELENELSNVETALRSDPPSSERDNLRVLARVLREDLAFRRRQLARLRAQAGTADVGTLLSVTAASPRTQRDSTAPTTSAPATPSISPQAPTASEGGIATPDGRSATSKRDSASVDGDSATASEAFANDPIAAVGATSNEPTPALDPRLVTALGGATILGVVAAAFVLFPAMRLRRIGHGARKGASGGLFSNPPASSSHVDATSPLTGEMTSSSRRELHRVLRKNPLPLPLIATFVVASGILGIAVVLQPVGTLAVAVTLVVLALLVTRPAP